MTSQQSKELEYRRSTK